MARKMLDVNNPPRLSPGSTEAVMKAYEEFSFGDSVAIKVPQREHLGSQFRQGISCQHSWAPVQPTEENEKFLKDAFGEQELGTSQLFCTRCGATSLWDNGLWAYDATTRFFGRVPKQEKPRDSRPNRRSR